MSETAWVEACVSTTAGSRSKAATRACLAGVQRCCRKASLNSDGILWENIAISGTKTMQAKSRRLRNFMAWKPVRATASCRACSAVQRPSKKVIVWVVESSDLSHRPQSRKNPLWHTLRPGWQALRQPFSGFQGAPTMIFLVDGSPREGVGSK